MILLHFSQVWTLLRPVTPAIATTTASTITPPLAPTVVMVMMVVMVLRVVQQPTNVDLNFVIHRGRQIPIIHCMTTVAQATMLQAQKVNMTLAHSHLMEALLTRRGFNSSVNRWWILASVMSFFDGL